MERKVATVLFADLVGSTQLGEDDPERVRVLLDRFFVAMREEVERVGGTVEKFAGDAVMAAFGAPAALEDHAERALHAALAMQRSVPDGLQLRVGVNTGEVVVDAGAESSFVTGDAVNVCARLEQNAEPGEILVGERTAQAARGAFEFDESIAVQAKGKSEPVPARRLVRALTLMRPRGVPGVASVFAGRERELAQLQDVYARVSREGRAELVTIAGEAGVGKTRLVRELWQWLGDHPDEPLRRAGRCLPYGAGITYWPLREVLQEQLGLRGDESADEVRAALGDREILGLALGVDLAADLHPLAVRDRLRAAWVEFAAELASARPLVLLVEDAHWAEPPLLELVERTVRDVGAPLLLITTGRPELEWSGGRAPATRILLDPLEVGAANAMLASLPDEAREFVTRRSEGNPFFAEELTATLIDQGALVRSDGGWTLRGSADGVAIPDSVRGVLAARIDLLPAAEKAALQAGAVIGRVFWDGAVRELIGHDADFGVLEERDFVRRRGGSSLAGELEYALKHALTREVAYASIPRGARAQLHAVFAGWLERRSRSDEVAPLIAHHYAEAVAPEHVDLAWAGRAEELERLEDRAVEWLRKAAAGAVHRYEIDDALRLLERAAELARDHVVVAEIWREIGDANALKFDGETFWSAMQRSLDATTDDERRADTYSELAFQTSIRSGMWRTRPPDELVEGWIDAALAHAPERSAAQARALLARAQWRGSTAEAIAGSELAERIGDAELRSWAWGARAAVAFSERQFDEAHTWAHRRFELEGEISDPDHLCEIRETALVTLTALGRFREARRLALEHCELSEHLTPHHRVHGISLRVETEELAGEWGAIAALEDEVRDAVRANADTPCIRNTRDLLLSAVASHVAGDERRAQELEQAAADTGAIEHPSASGPWMRLELVRGNPSAAVRASPPVGRHTVAFGQSTLSARLDALAALRSRLVEEEAPPLVRPGTYLEPFALRALGLVRRDDALVELAQDRFHAFGLEWHAAQTPVLARQ